jgi:hypothetical protein
MLKIQPSGVLAIVNLWGCHGNADCSNAWTELICRAQESARLLPPVGGHKGWILIDSDASRSLPFPRHRRNLLQFQHIHLHTHTHTPTPTLHNKWQTCYSLLSSEIPLKSRNFNMHIIFLFKTCLGICYKARSTFYRVTTSIFWNEIYLHPYDILRGMHACEKNKFYFLILYSWFNICSFCCHLSHRIFSVYADIDGWDHTFW